MDSAFSLPGVLPLASVLSLASVLALALVFPGGIAVLWIPRVTPIFPE